MIKCFWKTFFLLGFKWEFYSKCLFLFLNVFYKIIFEFLFCEENHNLQGTFCSVFRRLKQDNLTYGGFILSSSEFFC